MGVETLTDAEIAALLSLPKRVENPQAREKADGKHLRRDFRVVSLDESTVLRFSRGKAPDCQMASVLGCSGIPRRAKT